MGIIQVGLELTGSTMVFSFHGADNPGSYMKLQEAICPPLKKLRYQYRF